eukprot:m.76625 g.76625  ORF g.76625 m.76625 type:complete len:330 (-) comp11891_c0_seq1:986-1975(-)
MAVRQVLTKMGLQSSWRIAAAEVAAIKELANVDEKTLLEQLVEHASTFSQSPVSQFKVGAVGVGDSGDLYLGANIEFKGCSLAQSIHGEQCVISNAFLAGEKRLRKLVVSASPCGHCRQFMTELPHADDLIIDVMGNEPTTLGALLPSNFKTTDVIPDAKPLLQHQKEDMVVSATTPPSLIPLLSNDSEKEDENDNVVENGQHSLMNDMDVMLVYAVLSAATSYSPLSRCFSGVVLKTKTDKYITGSVIESAAFNPTLPPLQVAYVNLLISGLAWEDVTHVVLSEGTDNHSPASVLAPTCDILKTFDVVPSLIHVTLDIVSDKEKSSEN